MMALIVCLGLLPGKEEETKEMREIAGLILEENATEDALPVTSEANRILILCLIK